MITYNTVYIQKEEGSPVRDVQYNGMYVGWSFVVSSQTVGTTVRTAHVDISVHVCQPP